MNDIDPAELAADLQELPVNSVEKYLTMLETCLTIVTSLGRPKTIYGQLVLAVTPRLIKEAQAVIKRRQLTLVSLNEES